jgi:hypothetical protein
MGKKGKQRKPEKEEKLDKAAFHSKPKESKGKETGNKSKRSIYQIDEEKISVRYIRTMETQLRVKDHQLNDMNARLREAYEMQRALALMVKRYELSTGISSDKIWSSVPEEEVFGGLSQDSRPFDDDAEEEEDPEPFSNPERKPSAARPMKSQPEDEVAEETQQAKAERRNKGDNLSFYDWLRADVYED